MSDKEAPDKEAPELIHLTTHEIRELMLGRRNIDDDDIEYRRVDPLPSDVADVVAEANGAQATWSKTARSGFIEVRGGYAIELVGRLCDHIERLARRVKELERERDVLKRRFETAEEQIVAYQADMETAEEMLRDGLAYPEIKRLREALETLQRKGDDDCPT